MSQFLAIDDQNFQQSVLQADQPVLVEFGAEWCVPCKQMEPILIQLAAQEWAGKLSLARINVDHSVNTAMQYQIMSVPTLILFVNGEAKQRLTGKIPRERLIEKLSPFL